MQKKCRTLCSKIIKNFSKKKKKKNFSNSKALNQVWGPSELMTKCEYINSCSLSWPWTAVSPVLEQKIAPHAWAGRERPTGFEQRGPEAYSLAAPVGSSKTSGKRV